MQRYGIRTSTSLHQPDPQAQITICHSGRVQEVLLLQFSQFVVKTTVGLQKRTTLIIPKCSFILEQEVNKSSCEKTAQKSNNDSLTCSLLDASVILRTSWQRSVKKKLRPSFLLGMSRRCCWESNTFTITQGEISLSKVFLLTKYLCTFFLVKLSFAFSHMARITIFFYSWVWFFFMATNFKLRFSVGRLGPR